MVSEVLALYRQGEIAWDEATSRDENAVVGDDGLRLQEDDGADRLLNLLFGLRSNLQGGTVPVPVSRGGAAAWVDADHGGHHVDLTRGAVLVLVHNPTTGPIALVVYSSPDEFNRLDDRNESIPAGAVVAFGPYLAHGWAQHDGYLYLLPAAAGLRLAAIDVGG